MDRSADTRQAQVPRLGEVIRVFGTTGSFTFGGGSATISALGHEIVERRNWLNRDRFALCFALSRVTPGTNLLAFCVAAGASFRGMVGAATALIAASVPCSVIAVALTIGFAQLSDFTWFRALLGGVIAAAIGSLGSTAWLLIRPHWKRSFRIRTTVILSVALILNLGLGLSPVTVIVLAAAAGCAWPEASR